MEAPNEQKTPAPVPASPHAVATTASVASTANATAGKNRPLHESFPMLSFISGMLRFLGWAVFLGSLIYLVLWEGLLKSMGDNNGRINLPTILSGLGLAAGGLGAVIIGEAMGVVFAIERNTWDAARALEDVRTALASDIQKK